MSEREEEVMEPCGDCDSCVVGGNCPYAIPVLKHPPAWAQDEDERCDECRGILPNVNTFEPCTCLADENDRLRQQLTTAERERDEARRERDALNAEYAQSMKQMESVVNEERQFAERAERVVAFLRQHPGAIAYTGGEWTVWHREGCPARAQSYHAFFGNDFDAAIAHAIEQYANVPVSALDALFAAVRALDAATATPSDPDGVSEGTPGA